MLVYLPFLIVGVKAIMQVEKERLAWNLDILCRDFRDAKTWYPELPPPTDTHETAERIKRVTYGAIWRPMPPLRTGEGRKEQYEEGWWQQMSSSWGRNMSYEELRIKTGEEFARKSDESWTEYQERMAKIFWNLEHLAKMPPIESQMLKEQRNVLGISWKGYDGTIKSSDDVVVVQNDHSSELMTAESESGLLSMEEGINNAIALMDPEELDPLQDVEVVATMDASVSNDDIIKRDPGLIATYSAMKYLTRNPDGMPVHETGEKQDIQKNTSSTSTGMSQQKDTVPVPQKASPVSPESSQVTIDASSSTFPPPSPRIGLPDSPNLGGSWVTVENGGMDNSLTHSLRSPISSIGEGIREGSGYLTVSTDEFSNVTIRSNISNDPPTTPVPLSPSDIRGESK